MDFATQAYTSYRKKSNTEELLQILSDKTGVHSEQIFPNLVYPIHQILHNEPCSYWSEDIHKATFDFLQKCYAIAPNKIVFDYDILEHFLIGYNTYRQATSIINDLSGLNDNAEIKNRMYRIPTYISIIEGCLTNFFRFICLVLDCVSDKDFSSQKKLKPICDVLNANGLDILTQYINVNIRNAVSHGGVVMLEDGKEILFNFSLNRKASTSTLQTYELDALIDNAYDTASGVLLAICQFLNEHHECMRIDEHSDSFVARGLKSLELSVPGIFCSGFVDVAENKQLSVIVNFTEHDRDYIIRACYEIIIQLYAAYPQYEKYMVSVQHERILFCWLRLRAEELSGILAQTLDMADVHLQAIARKDMQFTEASDEIIDIQEYKYFRFPNYKKNGVIINSIEDTSTPERKRLKAHLFIGDTEDKQEIIDKIQISITWLNNLKNPPQPKIKVKHGDMEADSLYINVYRYDRRRKGGLLPNNENFVCHVDYNVDGVTTLKHGGLPQRIWDSYSHEKLGKIIYSWREKKYAPPKVGANDLCPCGSGKKFKKCCRE